MVGGPYEVFREVGIMESDTSITLTQSGFEVKTRLFGEGCVGPRGGVIPLCAPITGR